MNKPTDSRRAPIIRALVEGNSVMAASRLTSLRESNSPQDPLGALGEFCSTYQVTRSRIPCKRIEADENWSFVGAKAKNATQ